MTCKLIIDECIHTSGGSMAGLSQTRERGPEIAADVGHIWTGRSLLSAECTQTSIRVRASLLSFKERDPGLHQKV